MLAPAVVYITLLVALPFLLALFLSLTNSSAGSLEFSFVGLRNYVDNWNNPVFWQVTRNTFVFTISATVFKLIGASRWRW